jgi:HK97 family phage prohead protease
VSQSDNQSGLNPSGQLSLDLAKEVPHDRTTREPRQGTRRAARVRNPITALSVELRAAAGSSSRQLGGYAAVFNTPSRDLGGFTERLHPAVFNKSAGDQWPDVVCRFNHLDDAASLLGTTRAGTLKLAIDTRGLDYTVTPPAGRGDVIELVSRGDVCQSSFSFQAYDNEWDYRDGHDTANLVVLPPN